MNAVELVGASRRERTTRDIRIFESVDSPADPHALAVLERGVAGADLAAPAVVLPDFHLKPDKEMPSSIAVATRDTIRTTMTCCSLNCGMALVALDIERPHVDAVTEFYRRVRERLPFPPTYRRDLSVEEVVRCAADGARFAADKFGVDSDKLREAMAHVAWKNHFNGARNPRAQFRKEVSTETICGAPKLAGSLGVFDCAGVADGAAAAVVVRAEDAHKYTDKPVYVKALSLVAGTGAGLSDPEYDYTTFPEVAATAEDAYRQAGVTDPRHELAMAEVHDCFTPTEMVLMEDLGFAERGMAWKEVLAGTFDLDGTLPVNPDGGLKAFGHPIGATGLRMLFECWTQLRREAGDRQISSIDRGRSLALTHNLGGSPGDCVSFVSIVGLEKS